MEYVTDKERAEEGKRMFGTMCNAAAWRQDGWDVGAFVLKTRGYEATVRRDAETNWTFQVWKGDKSVKVGNARTREDAQRAAEAVMSV